MKSIDNLADCITLLESTADDYQRNHLAMDLAETGDPRVKAALIDLIQRPELVNNRGTLVYALENYDCSDQSDLLVELVRTGNFEVAMQACFILEEMTLPPERRHSVIETLMVIAKEAGEDWRRDFAEKLYSSE